MTIQPLPEPGATVPQRVIWAEGMLKAVDNDPMAFYGLDKDELGALRISLSEITLTAAGLWKRLQGETPHD